MSFLSIPRAQTYIVQAPPPTVAPTPPAVVAAADGGAAPVPPPPLAPDPAPAPAGVPVAGDAEPTQTATYLSTESLTFPGVTGVAGILVLLFGRLNGTDPSHRVIVVVAVVFGVGLIALGLLDPKRADKSHYGTATQIVVGLLNTVLLLSALLGIVSVTN